MYMSVTIQWLWGGGRRRGWGADLLATKITRLALHHRMSVYYRRDMVTCFVSLNPMKPCEPTMYHTNPSSFVFRRASSSVGCRHQSSVVISQMSSSVGLNPILRITTRLILTKLYRIVLWILVFKCYNDSL